eukprot:2011802-Rhodomonas_salina.4
MPSTDLRVAHLPLRLLGDAGADIASNTTSLCACYAMPGGCYQYLHMRLCATLGTELAYGASRRHGLGELRQDVRGSTAYALATRCPVLRQTVSYYLPSSCILAVRCLIQTV